MWEGGEGGGREREGEREGEGEGERERGRARERERESRSASDGACACLRAYHSHAFVCVFERETCAMRRGSVLRRGASGPRQSLPEKSRPSPAKSRLTDSCVSVCEKERGRERESRPVCVCACVRACAGISQ